MTTNEQPVNWIDPEMLAQVQGWIGDEVKQINSYTYEIFDAIFIVPGDVVNVGTIIGHLIDNIGKEELKRRMKDSNDDQ